MTKETIEKSPAVIEFLKRIDLLFLDFLADAGKATPALSGLLLLNAHASFRAAVRLALSGQLPPVFMALRGAIESTLYANAISADPDLADIWFHRHRDLESRNRCKNAFTIKKLLRSLAEAHERDFADYVKDLYEAAIDFGGHPNNRSLIRHVRLEQLEDADYEMSLVYLHGWESTELRRCLVACAETGIALIIIGLICTPHHSSRKSVNAKALAYENELGAIITQLGLQQTRSG